MPRIKINDYCRNMWHSNIFKYTYINTRTHKHPWNIEWAQGEAWQTSVVPSCSWGKRKWKAAFLLPKPHLDLPSSRAIDNHSGFDLAEEHFPRVQMLDASPVQSFLYKSGPVCLTLYTHSMLVTVSHASFKSSCSIDFKDTHHHTLVRTVSFSVTTYNFQTEYRITGNMQIQIRSKIKICWQK